MPQQPAAIWQIGGHHSIQLVEQVYSPAKQRSNRSWWYLLTGFKNTSKIAEIRGVFHYTSTTSGDMTKWITPLDSEHGIGLNIH